jgi:hypothetical protein
VHPVILYLVALGLTLAIETPLYALGLAVGVGGGAGDWGGGGSTGVRVNLVSHPLAFLIAFPILVPVIGALAALVAVEVGVVYLEAVLVWRRRHADPLGALALSCVANLTSLAIGLAVIR